MEEIFAIDSLNELREHLLSLPEKKTHRALKKLFFDNVMYQNVSQWNRTVRVCESLTIVGWGDLEPVEACRTKFFNGWPWTILGNRYCEERYIESQWSKRKEGFMMVDDRTIDHGSPDLPARLRKKNFVVTGEMDSTPLVNQRNWIPKNPVSIGQTICNCYESSNAFVKSVDQLKEKLRREMRPELYGSAIDQLAFYFHLSYLDIGCAKNYVIQEDEKSLSKATAQARLRKRFSAKEIRQMRYELVPRYLFRPFKSATGRMNISIHLEKEFSDLTTRQQKKRFAELIREGLETVIAKLRKKRMEYDFDQMQTDFESILKSWAR